MSGILRYNVASMLRNWEPSSFLYPPFAVRLNKHSEQKLLRKAYSFAMNVAEIQIFNMGSILRLLRSSGVSGERREPEDSLPIKQRRHGRLMKCNHR